MRYLISAVVLGLACSAMAETWTVDDDGPADFDNIQAAVEAASDGDEIVVEPGTYTSTGDRVVNMLGKAVTLRSSAGAGVTILDGEGAKPGLTTAPTGCVIDGFTISNGFSPSGGSGIRCFGGESPTVSNCVFQNGQTYGTGETGGAVFCYGSGTNPTFNDCMITENSGGHGAGVLSKQYASPHLINCTITGNTAYWNGGGVAAMGGGNMLLEFCAISHNTAGGEGGGGAASLSHNCQMVLINCVINSNVLNGSTNWGGGLFCDWNHGAAPPLVTYSTICANEPNQFYGWSGPDETNYVSDVCDQDSDGIDDEIDNCDLYNPDQADCNENGIGDVCDIADGVSEDINGNEIPDECDCLADVVVDGEVNINDVLVTVSSWGTSGPLGDVNYDGIVDVEDLLIVISAWGACP